ncbi:MAG: formate dehydrogenase subunit gamma [Ignavibacteria bacterium]
MSADTRKYLRLTINERIQHIFLLSSFITLVITGFALKYPETFWVKGLYAVLGKNAFEWRGIIHRIAAVIMILTSFYHLLYVIFTKRGRRFIIDLWFRKQDILDLIHAFKYYLGIVKEAPKFGRFSYIEKAEYWAVVWGTLVMGATGSILWAEKIFLPIVGTTGMDISTVIHFYEAVLASLAILVWHFYFVFINPVMFPMNKAWLSGYLTREQMEHEHPRELEQIEKGLNKQG